MQQLHSRAAAAAAALFLCATGALAPRPASAAAQFSIEPLLLTLRADRLATSLTLGNTGAKPVTVQAELVSWNQDGGEDAYAEAVGLIVSPPIFTLAPGAKQVVRVGRLKRSQAPERELAYRIRLTEVPPKASGQALATYMQLTLPVFVPPADREAGPALDVVATPTANGDLRLAVENAGLVRDKVTRLVLSQGGKVVAERALNYYVLAGAKRELVWPGALKGATAGPAELRIQLDGRKRFLVRTLAPAAPGPGAPPKPAAPPTTED
jgi:fimbrial chaperone protein